MAAVPLIAVSQLRLSWDPRAVDVGDRGGRWRGLFAQPLPAVGNVVVRVAARIVMLDGSRLRAPTAAEVKALRVRSVDARARATGGVNFSTAYDGKLKADGSFETETQLGCEPSTRRLLFDLVVERAGGNLTTQIELERIDLEAFIARVEAAEQRRPSGQSRLEFLASVRKIYQGGPGDKLAMFFDIALYRNRKVAPLSKPGDADYAEWRRFQTLWADGEFVDISHVLTGIEGHPRQDPSRNQGGFIASDPGMVVTWSGDLGKALADFAVAFAHAHTKGTEDQVSLQTFLDATASIPDLLGDLDGVNLGARYDDTRSLGQNLAAYYGSASRRRYSSFVQNTPTTQLTGRGLSLVPNVRPPKLSQEAREQMAAEVYAFAGPLILFFYFAGLSADESTLAADIVQPGSPEMELLLDYFVGFLERGMARER